MASAVAFGDATLQRERIAQIARARLDEQA
jgi:hypothetical protein